MQQGEERGGGRWPEGLRRRRTAVTDLEVALVCPIRTDFPCKMFLTVPTTGASLLKGNKRDKSRTHSIILADGGVAVGGAAHRQQDATLGEERTLRGRGSSFLQFQVVVRG